MKSFRIPAAVGLLLAVLPVGRGAGVEPQPFLAALRQVLDAADYLGAPFTDAEKAALSHCMESNDAESVGKAAVVLDAHCLFVVSINPEQRVKVAIVMLRRAVDRDAAERLLAEHGGHLRSIVGDPPAVTTS